jgi:hypothetical protein
LDTASGQANATGAGRAKAKRRLPLNPVAIGILLFIALLALGAMALVQFGIYPPPSSEESQTVADVWNASRTATPATLHTNLLKVEKVGTPVKEGDTVTVTLKVTNSVMQSAAAVGTPTPDAATPTPSQAKVYSGIVRVFFYRVNGKQQQTVGSGLGNVTNLAFGQSAQIQVVANGVGDFTDYVAFPESVWTDKDPVKPAETAAPAP